MSFLKVILKRIILILLSFLGYSLGLHRRRKEGVRILYYHSVNPLRKHEVNVLPHCFYKQMRFLKEHYRVISLDEFIQGKYSPGSIILTFDDGYQDNFLFAYPILQKFNFPATIFLTVEYIDSERILPHDRKDLPSANKLLTWEEIKEMRKGGIGFGSHGLSHRRLSLLKTPEIKREVEESKKRIEEVLKEKVYHFSYPYGTQEEISEEIKEIIQKAGYLSALTSLYGENTNPSHPFLLKRIGIEGSDNLFTFKAKICGALDLLKIKESKKWRILINFFNKILGV